MAVARRWGGNHEASSVRPGAMEFSATKFRNVFARDSDGNYFGTLGNPTLLLGVSRTF